MRYCGEPDESGCNACLARLGDDQGRPVGESISAWREKSAARLLGARRVFAPSDDVARRISRYFPECELTIRPHPESLPVVECVAARLKPHEPIRVALIGTVTGVKGSQRLLACAADARIRDLPLEFHVIGSTDRDAQLLRIGNVHISGRYREEDVFDLLASRGVHLAFLPSECPESYMYVLSIAMAAGFFVVCFDFGAQAERVRSWGWGRPIDPGLSPSEINDQLLAAARALALKPGPPPTPSSASYPDTLISYYDFSEDDLRRLGGISTSASPAIRPRPSAVGRRAHARLH
jgi:glycosyltransferase involved in cell wall biosynthesis